jgi:hypothetical protein
MPLLELMTFHRRRLWKPPLLPDKVGTYMHKYMHKSTIALFVELLGFLKGSHRFRLFHLLDYQSYIQHAFLRHHNERGAFGKNLDRDG